MKKLYNLLLNIVALLALDAGAQGFVNGDFNAGSVNCSGPPSWTTDGQVQTADIYKNGDLWIDITSCGSGNGHWMEQTITVVPGKTYFISMELGTWEGWDDMDAGVSITINGVPLGSRIFHDSFTHTMDMRCQWLKRESCLFTPKNSVVTVRITGDSRCTKSSPQTSCDNPYPGVIAVDNVVLHEFGITVPNKVCMNNNQAKLYFETKGKIPPYTIEWWYNGNKIQNDSLLMANQTGEYTLKLKFECTALEYKVQVGKSDQVYDKMINLCSGKSIEINGKTINSNTDIRDTFVSLAGCDSVVNFKVRFSQPLPIKDVVIKLCSGQSVLINGKTIKSNDELKDTFASYSGCDSIVNYMVQVYSYSGPSQIDKYSFCDNGEDSLRVNIVKVGRLRWLMDDDTLKSKTFRSSGFYQYELEYGGSCKDTFKIELADICNPPAWTPNGFSPNGDGFNDVFMPYVRGGTGFRLLVFNRWGEQLYDSGEEGKGWNGVYKNEMCQQGVYLYLLSYSAGNSKRKYYQNGTFTLLR
ncbi:MAG TPA: gliding motility-associated C-terminal domain-containing protein [Bacteroidia bacterium]